MRNYKWENPLNVPGFTGHVSRLVTALDEAGLWPTPARGTKGTIPTPLARRLSEAMENRHGVAITYEDLDTIPDDVWEKIEVLIKKMRG